MILQSTLFLESWLQFTYHFPLAKAGVCFICWNIHFSLSFERSITNESINCFWIDLCFFPLASRKPCANNCNVYLVDLPGGGSSAVYSVEKRPGNLSFSTWTIFKPSGRLNGSSGGFKLPMVTWSDEHSTHRVCSVPHQTVAALCHPQHPNCSLLWVSECFWSRVHRAIW